MKRNTHSHSIDTVFVLVVFSTFALSVLLVLALGAGVYRNINDISRELENERTALSYVRTKVRNLDNAGAFFIAPLSGSPGGGSVDALFINEDIGGTAYVTAVYCYDGWLCEIFSEASLNFTAQDGIRITKAEDLHFEQQDGSIKVTSGDLSLLLAVRSGGGT